MNTDPPIASGACVCVVDDDAAVGRAMASLLEACGYGCLGFASGAALLSWHDLQAIDVAIFDVTLSDMNGFALQQRCAARGFAAPLLYFSGHGDAITERGARPPHRDPDRFPRPRGRDLDRTGDVPRHRGGPWRQPAAGGAACAGCAGWAGWAGGWHRRHPAGSRGIGSHGSGSGGSGSGSFRCVRAGPVLMGGEALRPAQPGDARPAP